MAPQHRRVWPIVAVACAAILLVYWRSLSFGLYDDDYVLLRPWSTRHLLAVLTGPWLSVHQADYYRPLAIYIYKALFHVFGLNAPLLHIVPIVVMATIAALVGVFVRRETASLTAGIAAAVLYAVHPATVIAIGPWVANQYQGIVAIATITALLMWQVRRANTERSWWPLLVPVVIGALAKETGLMVPLILVGAHLGVSWWCRLPLRSRWSVAAAGVAVFGALNLWRALVLHGVGPYQGLTWQEAAVNFISGPAVMLFDPIPGSHEPLEFVFFAGSLALLASAWWVVLTDRTSAAARLVIIGAVLLVCASLPTSVVFSRDRLSPHGLGAVLIWSGGVTALLARLTAWRRVVAAVAAAGVLLASATIATRVLTRFDQCGSGARLFPNDLFEAPARVPPPEMVRWLTTLTRPCDPGLITPIYAVVPALTWGVIEARVGSTARIHRWVGDRVVALLAPDAESVNVSLRHVTASPARPVVVRIEGPRHTRLLRLTTPEWHSIRVPLAPTWWLRLRAMHRIELYADAGRGSAIEMRPLGWETVE